jgi:ubiquinone/menaquinone biosynthesis C-methylase UbiE
VSEHRHAGPFDRASTEEAERFDRYASRYAETVNASIWVSGEDVDFFANLKAALVRRALEKARPQSLLDFGCGTGLSTRALRRALPSIPRVVGIDPSADSIRHARDLLTGQEGVTYELSNPDRLPFADGTFDVVFTACVFHHIERGEHLHWLREIRRVLSPDGQFFLFEHNPYNPLTRRAVRDCPFDEGVTLLTPRYAREALRAAGLRVSRPRYYFFFPPALRVFRRFEHRLSRIPLGAQYYMTSTRGAPG